MSDLRVSRMKDVLVTLLHLPQTGNRQTDAGRPDPNSSSVFTRKLCDGVPFFQIQAHTSPHTVDSEPLMSGPRMICCA